MDEVKLGYRDLEERTGVYTDDDEIHHDAMPNWNDVCPNCNNPHWAWFKKGEHIKVEQVEFVAEEDGKLCLRCGHKWEDGVAEHNDYSDYSDMYSDWDDEVGQDDLD